MQILAASLAGLDGALIDLHPTENQDPAGLELLSFIRDRRPDLPRMLITASPPPGSHLRMRRTYGIVNILIKGANGYTASGVRDVVGPALRHQLERDREGHERRALEDRVEVHDAPFAAGSGRPPRSSGGEPAHLLRAVREVLAAAAGLRERGERRE
jgi:hypothetical protein